MKKHTPSAAASVATCCVALLLAAAGAAFAAEPPPRTRGTIERLDSDTLNLATRGGQATVAFLVVGENGVNPPM